MIPQDSPKEGKSPPENPKPQNMRNSQCNPTTHRNSLKTSQRIATKHTGNSKSAPQTVEKSNHPTANKSENSMSL
jgi:hypothetical protein